MTDAERESVAQFIEKTLRSRTPAKDVSDALPTLRVLYSDVLAAFPHFGVFEREEVTPIHNRVMRKLRREFPDERW